MTDWGIPELRRDMLATVVPAHVYGGGAITDPSETLFVWRTVATERARDGTLAFYLDDHRLEALWRNPERYAKQFTAYGIRLVVEVDFSMWTNDAVAVQVYNVFRMRALSRSWQESGLLIAPNLAWSDERSFAFCFSGIPVGCPVAMTECRTPGSNDTDRRAFLRGLTEAVQQLQPQHIAIYGGHAHRYWLYGNLPKGPAYTLLPSWADERGKVRARQKRRAREKNQLTLFPIGGDSWADADQVAA